MAVSTKSALEALNQSGFADNSSGAITPAILRTFETNMIDSVQLVTVEVTANITAVLDNQYINTASATYTDPTPAQGKGFRVLVRNGTATVGGVAYAVAGTQIYRVYHSGAWASYVGVASMGYTTISLASWTALVAANGLVAGTFYRVTAAYTFDFYGAKDIIVVADSVNTVQSTGWVVFGDFFSQYSLDADGSFTNAGTFFSFATAMALSPDAVLAYSGYNFRITTGLPIFIQLTGGEYVEAQISGDDVFTIIYTNVKKLNGANLGDFGTYTPETAPAAADDYFTPYPQPVQVRFEVSDAEIDAGTAINITELPEVVGYFWAITNAAIQYTGTTPYTNIMYVGIISKDPQYNDAGRLVAGTDSFGGMADMRSDIGGGNGDCYAEGRCQVTFSGTGGGGGDGVAVLFLTAQLVKIAA